MKTCRITLLLAVVLLAASCETTGNSDDKIVGNTPVYLDDVAEIFAQIPLEQGHLQEVYDAVSSSAFNGYDEEYTMHNLFENPGAGVGDASSKSSS